MLSVVFVVFKTKFQVIANLRKQGSKEVIIYVLMVCVALCNMIIENEGQILDLAWHDHNHLQFRKGLTFELS